MAEAARQQELAPVQNQGSAKATTATTTAIAEAGQGIYRDLPGLLVAFDKLRERFNVCFPVMKPDLIPSMYAVALRPVAIDARIRDDGEPLSPDVYRDNRDKRKYGLTKIALDKIAAAAGISWHPAYTGRVDDGSDPLFRTYRACGVVQNLDGTMRLITAHKTLDLRDGAPHGMTDKQIGQARLHIDALCESKAKNRVIRQYAFVKGLYEAPELRRPFVIAALVFTGETEDPELRREVAKALANRALGASAALFGPAPSAPQLIEDLGRRTSPPPLGVAVVDHDDADDAGGDDETRSATFVEDDTRGAQGAAQEKQPADGIHRLIATIERVSSESGKTNGRAWTRYTILTTDGVSASTFSSTIADTAKDAWEADRTVAIEATDHPEHGLQIKTLTPVQDVAEDAPRKAKF